MAQRTYNIIFHTHTISGIIISAALYVIFFTGSISFLRDEINAWERNEPIRKDYFNQADFDGALKALSKEQDLYGRDISFSHRYFERRVGASVTQSKDSTIKDTPHKGRRGNFFYLDMDSFQKNDYASNYSLGEFFYRLHFFAQLNLVGRSGYFLAGLVAFFFLFAVVTGVIIHWKKIIQGFYVFRPKAKWKTIWTDAHIALGMIGLPYQFVFALTGAYLIIGYTIMLPPVEAIMFEGDGKKLQQAMEYDKAVEYKFDGNRLDKETNIAQFVDSILVRWPELQLNGLQVFNYGDTNMHIKVSGSPLYSEKLLGTGYLTYRVRDGKLVNQKDPYNNISYAEGAPNLLRRLHYGDFGGYGIKLVYLILGFITCFVILSGVLIWLVARKNKSVSIAKQRFNKWLVHAYMAICLSLYPITAIAFIAMKLFTTGTDPSRMTFLYKVFFWGWLAFIILFLFKRNDRYTNTVSLLLGGLLGLFVPITNGLVTGNWLWVSWSKGYSQIFVVDSFWVALSLTAFAVLMKLRKNRLNNKLMENSRKKGLKSTKSSKVQVP
ncbi:Uncharacterized iron-regulated membrane protein [Arenibacter nanhaiticus]|uniref:Uncharacterized iron-regulated membrane protein n=1 Tax=Arenibacter nanhaiticus TaxID=558155 RepID=A0A1M6BZ56_9FLAO|nr:PepSY-associated TM helix domain-containing protein [Arenibacter nanhaiticus]SHI53774.1 Uncharacterized iron-regulated membrane protein [Arenibacter nanhaiticus]